MRGSSASKVLLIGWDAADWKVITPLIDQGLMPSLENFINHGVMGNLATLRPVLSPMLWNSIATGKRPNKHGILGFMEPDPQSGGFRALSSTSRKVKAIWNILTQRRYGSNTATKYWTELACYCCPDRNREEHPAPLLRQCLMHDARSCHSKAVARMRK